MPRSILALFFACALSGQQGQHVPSAQDPDTYPDTQLPNGKSQREEMLKADHKKNLEDAAAMAKLATEVSDALAKGDRNVISVKTLKNLDEIERLAKAMRGRLKKY
jgi:hypothetical protein